MKLNEYVETFSRHVGDAITAIESATKCYAQACREYPEKAQSALEERYKHVTPNTWAKFRAVGEQVARVRTREGGTL